MSCVIKCNISLKYKCLIFDEKHVSTQMKSVFYLVFH